jgi:hypothetical protein
MVYASGWCALNKIRIMPLGDSITESACDGSSYRCWLWGMLDSSGYSFEFVGSREITKKAGDYYRKCPYESFDERNEGHYAWEIKEVLYDTTYEDEVTYWYHYPGTIGKWISEYPADIVLVHLGTNDVLRGRDVNSAADMLGYLVDTLRSHNPDIAVVLAQILPSWWNNGTSIDAFNKLIPQVAADKSTVNSPVIFVDCNTGIDP